MADLDEEVFKKLMVRVKSLTDQSHAELRERYLALSPEDKMEITEHAAAVRHVVSRYSVRRIA